MYKLDLLVVVSLVSLISMFSCVVKSQSGSRPPVGGQCEYKQYRGKAEIISITKRADAAEGYEIRFSFHTEEPIQEEFARVEGKEYLLLLNNSSYPGADFVGKYGIEVGKRFDCYMKVITKGTCTPILFEFPTMDR